MAQQASVIDLGFTPERYPTGTHACFMFIDEMERRNVIHPFVRAGLHEQEDVSYFADALVTELFDRAIDERSVTALSGDELARLNVSTVEQAYFPAGVFVPQDMIARLRGIYESSRSRGATGCRVTGEMNWALRGVPGAERVVEYEASINPLVAECPFTVLCQYDTELFDGEILFEILSVHPLMVVRGQMMRNPYYQSAEALEEGSSLVQSQEDVLGRLYLVPLVIEGLPDERRIAEFTRGAFLRVPGIRDVTLCLTGTIIPPDDRWESLRERCVRAAEKPNALDVAAIEAETGLSVHVLRTTSRLFGLVLLDVDDTGLFAPYCDVLVNVTNAIALTLDSRRSQSELRAWPERVASLERRLWRIAREFEGVELPGANMPEPFSQPGVAELSPRQWEVLTRLLHGDRVPRIAEELFLSQSTVRNHLADIFRKMGVHSQEELLDLFRTPPEY
jgi:DNA-binding CsgD family transcriptional regulator